MNKFSKYKLKPKPIPKGPIVKRIYQYKDRLFKAEHHKCDLCDEYLPTCKDDIESHIDKMEDINNSYESEYDRHEPKLLLCAFCTKEYNIPSWIWLDWIGWINKLLIE